jgi:hypothetical protein
MGTTHHDGITTYGSGYYFGAKGSETPLFGTGIRADAGLTGFSGLLYSVSTKLSSIIGVVAAARYPQGSIISGKIASVFVDWSGSAMDFQTVYVNTSTNTSAPACSGQVSWIAFGL